MSQPKLRGKLGKRLSSSMWSMIQSLHAYDNEATKNTLDTEAQVTFLVGEYIDVGVCVACPDSRERTQKPYIQNPLRLHSMYPL